MLPPTPSQSVAVVTRSKVISAGSSTVKPFDAMQPLRSVTFTVYVPGSRPLMIDVLEFTVVPQS